MTKTTFPPLVVMGVSGCGKSTVGSLLARQLGLTFIDGDDLHPAANKEKMGAGIPLDDADRHPWLAEIGRTLRDGASAGVIVACSALKRRYRDQLRAEAGEVLFLHLNGDPETLSSRVAGRQHEFMPAAMLDSQLAALEPLGDDEAHVLLDIRESPAELVEQARQALMDDGATRPAGSLT
jgi:gluconokinase